MLDNPADDLVRLVYADWLDERETDDAKRKAEFLRATCELAAADTKKGRRATLRKRLPALAADLEPDWLAVVSRLKIENCGEKRTAASIRSGSRMRRDGVGVRSAECGGGRRGPAIILGAGRTLTGPPVVEY